MKFFLAAVFLTLCAATANANFIYNVDRTLGGFTLAGTIATNVNNGVLATGNIIMPDTSLTLSGDNFSFGVVNVFIQGSAVSATPEELLYDFTTGAENTFLLFGTGGNLYSWCLETKGCSDGAADPSEFIDNGTNVAFQQDRTGEVVVFATVVPVPAAVWLFASGLLGLVGIARRKR